MLSSIRIVLVNTTHPGNIGAAARAMKNMGLSKLYLVNPAHFPHAEATARASGADDLLAEAQVTQSLQKAIADCNLVIGSSARMRGIPWPMQAIRQTATQIVLEAEQTKVAVLFGQEQSGLTNEELAHCHAMVNIPADPHFSSLNLAQAVQVVCYEIFMASLSLREQQVTEKALYELDQLAAANEMEKFYEHLQQTLIKINFLDPRNPRKLMQRLIRLFNRTRLEKREVNILRGILTAISEREFQK